MSQALQPNVVRHAPSIRFTPDAWERFQCLIRSSRIEISGFGTVEEMDYGFLVTELFLLEQEGNFATTLIDPLTQGRFLNGFIESGGNPEKLRLWWHTHGTTRVFWSSTDDATMEQLLTNHYMLGIVGNAFGDCLARVDLQVPHLPSGRLSIDQIAIDVDYSQSVHLETTQQEIRQKVRIKKLPPKKQPPSVATATVEVVDEEEPHDGSDYTEYFGYPRLLEADGHRQSIVIELPH